MKKLLLTVVLLITTVGCVHQNADITDVNKAIQFCESRGGIKQLRIFAMGTSMVSCANGEQSHLEEVTL